MGSENLKQQRVGMEFITNENYTVKVIDYVNRNKVFIEFQDEHKYRTWVYWQHLVNGKIRNPFHKSVCGIGYIGLLSDGTIPQIRIDKQVCREYMVWYGMIYRITSEIPWYENIGYDEELLCYSHFLEFVLPNIINYDYWLNNPNKRVALDKDYMFVFTGKYGYWRENLMFLTINDNSNIVNGKKIDLSKYN